MGEPGLQDMADQRFGHLGVAEQPLRVRGVAAPTPEMHLVDRERRVETYAIAPGLHPVGVTPFVGQIPHDRPGPRRILRATGERIGLFEHGAIRGS